MAKYKILVIAHLLKNNQVGKFGETVDESQLTADPNELVNNGFIELVNEIEDIEVDLEDAFKIATLTKSELIQFAKDNDIEVTETLKKAEILTQIENQLIQDQNK